MKRRHSHHGLIRLEHNRKGKPTSWLGIWYEHVPQRDGLTKLRQFSRKLCEYSDRYRTESDVRPLLNEILAPRIGSRREFGVSPLFTDFVTLQYLPFVEREKRASTLRGYKVIWNSQIEPRVRGVYLRDFTTADAYELLQSIARDGKVCRSTIQHIKSFVSGIFTFAKNVGVYSGTNPMRDTMLPKAHAGQQTFAYSLPEIKKTLDALPLLSKAAFAVAAYAGLREGEIAGLDWSDYSGDAIQVSHSYYRGTINPPKTPASAAPVPVIAPLRSILDAYRHSLGNPKVGPVFPIDLNNLGRRIRETMERIGLTWHGWHAARRGIASNLFALGVDDLTVQRILRHAKVTVTRERYIKVFEPTVVSAMKKFGEAVEAQQDEPKEQAERMAS